MATGPSFGSSSPLASQGTASSRHLLRLARGGDRNALDRLFSRHLPRLYRWTQGRLPRWARDLADTVDLVQETALRVFTNVDHFEPLQADALQKYLRRAVVNRIKDEYRRAERRPRSSELDEERLSTPPEASPLEAAIGSEMAASYAAALARLTEDEQRLIVGRVEMGYSYDQIALMMAKRTPDAARAAVGRALVRLAEEMGRVAR